MSDTEHWSQHLHRPLPVDPDTGQVREAEVRLRIPPGAHPSVVAVATRLPGLVAAMATRYRADGSDPLAEAGLDALMALLTSAAEVASETAGWEMRALQAGRDRGTPLRVLASAAGLSGPEAVRKRLAAGEAGRGRPRPAEAELQQLREDLAAAETALAAVRRMLGETSARGAVAHRWRRGLAAVLTEVTAAEAEAARAPRPAPEWTSRIRQALARALPTPPRRDGHAHPGLGRVALVRDVARWYHLPAHAAAPTPTLGGDGVVVDARHLPGLAGWATVLADPVCQLERDVRTGTVSGTVHGLLYGLVPVQAVVAELPRDQAAAVAEALGWPRDANTLPVSAEQLAEAAAPTRIEPDPAGFDPFPQHCPLCQGEGGCPDGCCPCQECGRYGTPHPRIEDEDEEDS